MKDEPEGRRSDRGVRRAMGLMGRVGLGVLALALGVVPHALAQGQASSARSLVGLTGPQIEALYRSGVAAPLGPGRVRGTLLPGSGRRSDRLVARGARALWQGKIFAADDAHAINRFFGIRMIRANVGYGPSWLDGAPAIILDYSQTSRLYAPYRDEIRQIAPGLYLGLMFDRRSNPPILKTYFALEKDEG